MCVTPSAPACYVHRFRVGGGCGGAILPAKEEYALASGIVVGAIGGTLA